MLYAIVKEHKGQTVKAWGSYCKLIHKSLANQFDINKINETDEQLAVPFAIISKLFGCTLGK